MPKKQEVIEQCEALWKSNTQGHAESSTDANRESEGSYVQGYRNDINTWETKRGGYVVRTKKVAWQMFNLAADTKGTRRVLEIVKDGKVVFQATQEGAGTKKNFGAEERYTGTDTIDAKEWQVEIGTVPFELTYFAT